MRSCHAFQRFQLLQAQGDGVVLRHLGRVEQGARRRSFLAAADQGMLALTVLGRVVVRKAASKAQTGAGLAVPGEDLQRRARSF